MKKTAVTSVALMMALAVPGFIPAVGGYSSEPVYAALQETEVPSLKDTFQKNFMMGTEVSADEVEKYGELIKHHYNILKPAEQYPAEFLADDSCSISEDGTVSVKVNFSDDACKVFRFCEENGIALKGGPLVWCSSTPDWFFRENFKQSGGYVKPEEMDERLEAYIKSVFETIAEKFPDLKVDSFDICYEMFINDGGGLRPENQSDWTKVYGTDDSYIVRAFGYARKYAPEGCKLLLSDYNLEVFDEKLDDVLNMALKLKSENLIDGISIESPVIVGIDDIAQRTGKAIEKLSSTGLSVQITEFEIDTVHKDINQSELYKSLFRVFADNSSSISAVMTFGISDNSRTHREFNGLLFNYNYEPKDLFYDVINYSKTDEPVEIPSENAGTGDANLDGVINTADVVAFSEYMLKSSEISADALKEMDINGDGSVNILDFIKLKQILLK